MTDERRLPALVQPQLWVGDNACDVGDPIHFDAHEAMLALPARDFRWVSAKVFERSGNDYDAVAITAGVVDDWIAANSDATFLVNVDGDDFSAWLASMGLTRHEAVLIDEDTLVALRAAQSSPHATTDRGAPKP